MPVTPFLYRALSTEHMIFAPYHEVGDAGGDGTVAFWAFIGLAGVDGRHELHKPVPVFSVFDRGRGIENSRDIAAAGSELTALPLASR